MHHKALLERMPAGRTSGLLDCGGSFDRGSKAGPDMIRLLLVEDDPFQADAILALCHQCRYQTQVASSAGAGAAFSPFFRPSRSQLAL